MIRTIESLARSVGTAGDSTPLLHGRYGQGTAALALGKMIYGLMALIR